MIERIASSNPPPVARIHRGVFQRLRAMYRNRIVTMTIVPITATAATAVPRGAAHGTITHRSFHSTGRAGSSGGSSNRGTSVRGGTSIVGGSGAGKTTLLEAMAGVTPPASGCVCFDGADLYSNLKTFRTVLGYVPQDDIIHTELPLERTLRHAARLRLAPADGKPAIDAAVRQAMDVLDLTERAGTRVSALSGGQRKRASIAVELLTRPREHVQTLTVADRFQPGPPFEVLPRPSPSAPRGLRGSGQQHHFRRGRRRPAQVLAQRASRPPGTPPPAPRGSPRNRPPR